MGDDDLIEQITLGNEAAAEELIKRYYAAILRYCKWHCSSIEKAEDLTQETFFKLFRNLSQYGGKQKFKSYLYTIANHLCIDESRRRPLFPLSEADLPAKECGGIRQTEDREEIKGLLCCLTAEQREAILLRFAEELSYLEIARVTGCHMRTAQSRVRTALKIMRKEKFHET